MKVILLYLAVSLMAIFAIISVCKYMNPLANQNLDIPWNFPIFAIISIALVQILLNQEDILHHLKNKK